MLAMRGISGGLHALHTLKVAYALMTRKLVDLLAEGALALTVHVLSIDGCAAPLAIATGARPPPPQLATPEYTMAQLAKMIELVTNLSIFHHPLL